jgi:hypothetical protein
LVQLSTTVSPLVKQVDFSFHYFFFFYWNQNLKETCKDSIFSSDAFILLSNCFLISVGGCNINLKNTTGLKMTYINYSLFHCIDIIINLKLEAQHWAEPVSLTLHSALKKLNTEHSIAYRCFPQASTLTFFLICPFGQLTKKSCKSKPFGLVL